MGGGGRWLLLEMPFQGWPIKLPQILADLEIRGYGVILAHPERAEAVQRAPDRMRDIVGRGALVQLTAQSLLGELGQSAQRAARMLLAGGVAHFIASDAHSAGPWRPPGMEEGLAAAADAIDVHIQALSWMVEDGPAAVLEGGPVRPPRLTPGRRPRGVERRAPGRAAMTDSRVTPRPSAQLDLRPPAQHPLRLRHVERAALKLARAGGRELGLALVAETGEQVEHADLDAAPMFTVSPAGPALGRDEARATTSPT